MNTMMYHYYRIPKNSEMGEQLTAIFTEGMAADQAADDFACKVKADAYYPLNKMLNGGIAACEFKHRPDAKCWQRISTKRSENRYMPNPDTPEGRALRAELDALPVVPAEVLTKVFGLKPGSIQFGSVPIPGEYWISISRPIALTGALPLTKEEYDAAEANYYATTQKQCPL